MSEMKALPAWPEVLSVMTCGFGTLPPATHTYEYQRARAEAALARLRLCQEWLHHIQGCTDENDWAHGRVTELIDKLGDIPRTKRLHRH